MKKEVEEIIFYHNDRSNDWKIKFNNISMK